VNVICMGDQTERAAKFYGLNPDGKPENPSKEALIDAILGTGGTGHVSRNH
jgi:uroporphyrinogen-III synthase